MTTYFDNTWKYGVFEFSFLPAITYYRLMWKDKFGTCRIERAPQLKISWLGFEFGFYYSDAEMEEKINKKYYSHLFKKELLTEKMKNKEE